MTQQNRKMQAGRQGFEEPEERENPGRKPQRRQQQQDDETRQPEEDERQGER